MRLLVRIKSVVFKSSSVLCSRVIFEHLYELSDGKINLLQSTEELLNTTDLMRTNKRMSNKISPAGQPKIQSNKNNNNNNKGGKQKPFQKNNNQK